MVVLGRGCSLFIASPWTSASEQDGTCKQKNKQTQQCGVLLQETNQGPGGVMKQLLADLAVDGFLECSKFVGSFYTTVICIT